MHPMSRQLCKHRADAQQGMQGLWHISGESVCWSFSLCMVVSQLEFSVFGRLTQKPRIEMIFTLALRSGAQCWKGSPQPRVRNALAAILNHLKSSKIQGPSFKRNPNTEGPDSLLNCSDLKKNCFEVETPKIIRGTILKTYSTNCTNASVLGVH